MTKLKQLQEFTALGLDLGRPRSNPLSIIKLF